MSNIEAVREYRRAVDAAEGLRLADGLAEVLDEGMRSGELSTNAVGTVFHALAQVWLEVEGTAEQIGLPPGRNSRTLQRRVTRLRDDLVKKNMPLVWRVARRTLGARKTNQANLEEAVQEGAIGLVRAIEEFDETRGSFSTCAAYWIRHHVQNCMFRQVDFAKQRSACMPRPVVRAVNRYRLQFGREPEPHEIEHKGKPCTKEQWDRWTDTAYVQSVEEMTEAGDDETAGSSSDIIADESTSPDLVVASAALRDRLFARMAEMSPRNRDMSRMLFVEGRTLTDVAAHYDLSVERVRELKGSLEKRLREALAT